MRSFGGHSRHRRGSRRDRGQCRRPPTAATHEASATAGGLPLFGDLRAAVGVARMPCAGRSGSVCVSTRRWRCVVLAPAGETLSADSSARGNSRVGGGFRESTVSGAPLAALGEPGLAPWDPRVRLGLAPSDQRSGQATGSKVAVKWRQGSGLIHDPVWASGSGPAEATPSRVAPSSSTRWHEPLGQGRLRSGPPPLDASDSRWGI
jgi:hypothetical protein